MLLQTSSMLFAHLASLGSPSLLAAIAARRSRSASRASALRLPISLFRLWLTHSILHLSAYLNTLCFASRSSLRSSLAVGFARKRATPPFFISLTRRFLYTATATRPRSSLLRSSSLAVASGRSAAYGSQYFPISLFPIPDLMI